MVAAILWMQQGVDFTDLALRDKIVSLTLTILLAVAVFGGCLFSFGIRMRHFKSKAF